MFRATIKDGKLSFGPVILRQFEDFLAANDGKAVVVALDKPHRSQSQNSYYWVFLGVIERETGQNADEVHEWAKRKFLPPRFITVNGEEMKIPGSTRDLDKAAFGDFLDKLAAEVGIALPDPEAAGYISNYEPIKKSA